MRLDKYLKVSRLIKRRPVAKKMADAGRVFVNDRVAKPSTEIELGDIIRLEFEHRRVVAKVISLDKRDFNQASAMYDLCENIKKDD